MAILTFRPKQVTKRLSSVLGERPRFVITNRFGLGDEPNKMTLDGIGSIYGITRERVRQIENFALAQIRKSDEFAKEQAALRELRDAVDGLGAIISEDDLLSHISKDTATQNHVYLLLVLGEDFTRHKEDKEFRHRWTIDPKAADRVHDSLRKLYQGLSKDDLVPESEMLSLLLSNLEDVEARHRDEEVLRRWLKISKNIDRNPLGDWGIAQSSNINARGIRDLAYLVIRRHGSPMHFTEVAQAISEAFGKKAHVATCHNELIKDPRFVLVGRGLYALKEWGYENGVVKDVISNILKKDGPLTREEIINRVLNERYVKENTIVVNLQDSKHFKKDGDRYTVAD